MIYPEDFEKKIGFDEVRATLGELCSLRLGKDYVAEMNFSSNFGKIKKELGCVSELMSILKSGVTYVTPSAHDVIPFLNEIKAANSFMTAERLYRLLQILISFTEVRNFYCSKCKEDDAEDKDAGYIYPNIARELEGIGSFPMLIGVISKAVNKFGELKDNASPGLYDVRQQIKRSTGSMQRQMKLVIDRAVKQGLVDKDTTPSMRDGRLVIPVAAGNKRELSGIVHDESATGKTVFIEPAEVVEAGNRLRELEMEEKREETKILIEIASQIRPHIREISESCMLLGQLDFIIAKARYAIDTDAHMPNISAKRELEWYHAVHPVLLVTLRKDNKQVVPLDITLDAKHRILIVSGPNAGGKSVTLKTVAIVQYMFQCGVMPTVYENSHLGIFHNLMIDIGDEQSLENELSTYSSHLRNMRFFLQHSDSNTLLLADEMGSGTEPQIGGAMAQAILDKLGMAGAFGVVTTHYQNLKTFATKTDGFVNGAMQYDRQHLQSLFRLEIGVPGNSFALDIAHKMGLPHDVIANAKEIVGSDYVDIDKYMSEIVRDRRYWNSKRLSIKEKEARIDAILDKYEEQTDDIKQRRREILDEARRTAREIVEGLNAKIERTILDIRNIQAEKARTKELRSELNQYVEEVLNPGDENTPNVLKEIKRKKRNKKKQPALVQIETSKPETQRMPATGDYVTMEGSNMAGEVLSVSGNKAEVAFGSLRTIVDIAKLKITRKPKSNTHGGISVTGVSISNDSRDRLLNFRREIDVRGMRADEALQTVTYFLDDAIQFQADKVRILHGTGHGILKTLIRQQLKANPAIASFEDEDIRFGGAGITVVYIA